MPNINFFCTLTDSVLHILSHQLSSLTDPCAFCVSVYKKKPLYQNVNIPEYNHLLNLRFSLEEKKLQLFKAMHKYKYNI